MVGDMRNNRLTSMVNAVARLVFCIVGFYIAGLKGFILGLALGSTFAYCTMIFLLRKMNISCFIMDIKYSVFLVLIIGLYYVLLTNIPPLNTMASVAYPILFIGLVILWAVTVTTKQLSNGFK